MWHQQISRRELVPFGSRLATDPRAPHGDDTGVVGSAGGVPTERARAGEGPQTGAAVGRERSPDAPHPKATESTTTLAATDALGNAALPWTDAAARLADALSGALGFPASRGAAAASLRQPDSRSATRGHRG